MYGNNIAIGLPHEGSGVGAGPFPSMRRSTDYRPRRYHPYTVSNLGGKRKREEIHSTADDFSDHPTTHYAVTQPVSYLPDCQLPRAGALLASALYRQDYLPFNAGSHLICYPREYDLKTLQNLCDPASQTRTSFSDVSTLLKKERSHPFYCRQRSEPTDGMIRTRDKYRVVYTEKQRRGLEKEYKTNKFITTERKAEISRELDLSERQTKIWFQNRRAKERRDSRKTKNAEQIDSEKLSQDDNDITDNSLDCVTSTNVQASCRFAYSNGTSETKPFSSGQCRYMSQPQPGCIGKDTLKTFNSSKSRFVESRDAGMPNYPVSPSEWSAYTDSSFIPSLDVSPIMGNINTDFVPRL